MLTRGEERLEHKTIYLYLYSFSHFKLQKPSGPL